MSRPSGRSSGIGDDRTTAGTAHTAVTAAAGLGILAGVTGAAVVAMLGQARGAVRAIEQAAVDAAVLDGLVPASDDRSTIDVARLPVPRADGIYLSDGSMVDRVDDAGGRPWTIAMLGDSTAVGYGVRRAAELPGVGLAMQAAAELGRPIRLRTHGLSGVGAADLDRQVTEAQAFTPDLAVIVVGANDIRDKVPPRRSADELGAAVVRLRAARIPVVVGTCPDFGVIEPIPQPLRTLLHTWSRLLATLQERAVLAAGGRAVAIGRVVSPGFAHHPELFAADHFHPSGAGYARAVTALLPPVVDELRALGDASTDNALSAHRRLAQHLRATADPARQRRHAAPAPPADRRHRRRAHRPPAPRPGPAARADRRPGPPAAPGRRRRRPDRPARRAATG